MLQGDSSQQLPPDLPSYLFKERIVYLVRATALAGGCSARLGGLQCQPLCRAKGELRCGLRPDAVSTPPGHVAGAQRHGADPGGAAVPAV